MSRFSERFEVLNREWNDLPRRTAAVLTALACFLLAAFLFPYAAPFVFSALLAFVIGRPVRFLSGLLGGGRKSRAAAAAVMVTLFSAGVLSLAAWLSVRLAAELRALLSALPAFIDAATRFFSAKLSSFGLNRAQPWLLELLGAAGAQLAGFAASLAPGAAAAALKTASVLPRAMLFLVLTAAGAYYLSAEPQRIPELFRAFVPERLRSRSLLLCAGVLRCVVCQVRAAAVMLLVNFVLLALGLTLLGQEYALAIAGAVALLDALPVLGAGLFLLPAGAYHLFAGAWVKGAGFLLLQLAAVAVRQLLEPRLIGRQLGLHPLTMMASMYAGLHAAGFAGLLAGPLLLLVVKISLTDAAERGSASQPRPPFPRRRRSPDGA